MSTKLNFFVRKLARHQLAEHQKPFLERNICPCTTGSQEALLILCEVFLGPDYSVPSPLSSKQLITIMVDDICSSQVRGYAKLKANLLKEEANTIETSITERKIWEDKNGSLHFKLIEAARKAQCGFPIIESLEDLDRLITPKYNNIIFYFGTSLSKAIYICNALGHFKKDRTPFIPKNNSRLPGKFITLDYSLTIINGLDGEKYYCVKISGEEPNRKWRAFQ